MSRKQMADEARLAYLRHLEDKGIALVRVPDTKEVVFRTTSGKTVRMPFANEKTKGDAWWWGLPDNEAFDFFVLLGNSRAGAWLDFVFPYAFLSPIWNELLPDNQGGVNLTICDDRYGNYRLVLKRGRLKPVSGFLGAVEPLRGSPSPN